MVGFLGDMWCVGWRKIVQEIGEIEQSGRDEGEYIKGRRLMGVAERLAGRA